MQGIDDIRDAGRGQSRKELVVLCGSRVGILAGVPGNRAPVMDANLADDIRELLPGGCRSAGIPTRVKDLSGSAGTVDERPGQRHSHEVVRNCGTQICRGAIECQRNVVGWIRKRDPAKQAARAKYQPELTL